MLCSVYQCVYAAVAGGVEEISGTESVFSFISSHNINYQLLFYKQNF